MMERPKQIGREVNPFEDKEVAEQWIRAVEGEKGFVRDKEIYPLLEGWGSSVGKGTMVEIGAGQGACSQHLGDFKGDYVGVEPSERLVERAKELYGENEKLHFVVGSAYQLPLKENSAEGVFSVNVWFHLADLPKAGAELARVLKKDGKFVIVTANPQSYDLWRSFFEDVKEEGKMFTGRVNIPVNPLSRNDFYMHSEEEMTSSLEAAGLTVSSISTLGHVEEHPNKPLFISIQGSKSRE